MRQSLTSKNPLYWYFAKVRQEKLLTLKEEKAYIKQAQKGNIKARDIIITAYQRLVIKTALRYKSTQLSLMDLIAEGNIGLMSSITKFKPSYGFRFGTYAVWWIKNYIGRAMQTQQKSIYVPASVLDIYHKYIIVTAKNRSKIDKDRSIYTIAKKLKIAPDRLTTIINIVQPPRSLTDVMYNKQNDTSWILEDIIEDKDNIKPDDYCYTKIENERILKLICSLSEQEAMVILSRFGLNNNVSLTLREIAAKLNVSHEQIRKIEEIALKKLKNLLMDADE